MSGVTFMNSCHKTKEKKEIDCRNLMYGELDKILKKVTAKKMIEIKQNNKVSYSKRYKHFKVGYDYGIKSGFLIKLLKEAYQKGYKQGRFER